MLLHPLHWNTNGRRSSFRDKFNVRFDCSGSVCEFTAIFLEELTIQYIMYDEHDISGVFFIFTYMIEH